MTPWLRPAAAGKIVGLALLGGLSLVDAGGCAKKQPGANTAAGDSQQKVGAIAAPSPTDDEARVLGEKVEQVVAAGEVLQFNELIDWNAVLDRSMQGLGVSKEFDQGFRKGFFKQIKERINDSIEGQVCQAASHGGSYKLLHIVDHDGRKAALFRLLMDSGLNYHRLELAKQPNGSVKVVDIYVYLSGEPLSQTFRRLIVPIAAGEGNLLQKLTGHENEALKHLDRFREMAAGVRSGQGQQVLAIYRSLPENLQHEKSTLLLRMQAARLVGDEEYTAAIKDFRRQFPRDPAVDLVSIDYFLLQKRYSQARECVDHVDTAVGGDPHLQVMQANIYMESGDLDEARNRLKQAVDAGDQNLDTYWALVGLTLSDHDYAQTRHWLNEIAERFHMEFADFRTLPQYAEFVKSPEYPQWLAEHPPAEQPATGQPSAEPEAEEEPVGEQPAEN